MVRLLTSIFAMLCICLFAFVPAKAGPADDQVKAAYSAWDEAFNKGDAKAVAAFYTDDAIFLPATHDVIKGPDGVEKFFGSLFGMGVTGHKLEVIEVQEDGNLLVGTAKWSAKGKDAKGADQPWAGVATHVFEKQADGSLKLKLHTFN
ncbi:MULTISPECIES: SgcJ/EcaC family oxidoreductase [unclassified Sinorhizobium]|uniref:YybH family protein n=1 Tax=unclassified Sinorhizobium TaxID=2613772 RepID=UPI00352486D7